MKIKIILTFLLFAAFQITSIGQVKLHQIKFLTPEDFDKVKERPIIFVLREEDPKTVKKLQKKPELLRIYQNQISDYNKHIKALAEKEWKLSTHIIFKTESELDEIKKEKKENAYLKYSYSNYINTSYGYSGSKTTADWETPYLRLGFTDADKPDFIVIHNLSDKNPSAGELSLALRIMQNRFTDEGPFSPKKTKLESREDGIAYLNKRASLLRDRVLLINKDLLDKKLTVDKIKEVYPLPFEITDLETIEKYLLEANGKYAYIYPSFALGGPAIAHTIIDLIDSQMITFTVVDGNAEEINHKAKLITSKRLKSYLKYYKN